MTTFPVIEYRGVSTFHWPPVHGLPEWTAKWTTLYYLPWKKKVAKVTKAWSFWSIIVKAVSTKDLVSNLQVERVKILLNRQRCKRSSIFKFLLASVCYTELNFYSPPKVSAITRDEWMHRSVEQLTSSIKKEKQNNQALVIFFFLFSK